MSNWRNSSRRRRLGNLAVIMCGAALLSPASAAQRKLYGPCPTQGETKAEVTGIDDRLDIALKDGRILHLAGIEAPRPTANAPELDRSARDELAKYILGREIAFTPVAQKPDRWGRVPALAFLNSASLQTSGVSERSIALILLRAGLARVKPQAENRSCARSWLATEAQARTARLGLWADPYYAIIAADDDGAFAERAATNVIVEGRLSALVPDRSILKLEFGPDGAPKRGHKFSVIILHRNIRTFEQADMKFQSLVGRKMRVRGLLDMQFGPQIEISNPEDIEMIGEDAQAPLPSAKTPDVNVPVSSSDP